LIIKIAFGQNWRFLFILKIWKFRLWRKDKKSAVEFHSTLSFAQTNWTLQNKIVSFQALNEWKIALSKMRFSEMSCFYAEARTFFERNF